MTARPTPANRDRWWVTTPRDSYLHAMPAEAVNPDSEDALETFRWEGATATAECGQEDVWWWPGVFSRMGFPRCARCCDQVGIAHGKGTPGNEVPDIDDA